MAVDLTTFGGLTVIVTTLLQLSKHTFPGQVKGRERLISLALSVALAVASKLSGIGFGDIDWLTLVISAIFVSASAGALHEHVIRKPRSGRAEEGTPKGPLPHDAESRAPHRGPAAGDP